MIITIDTGDVVAINEQYKPKVVVGNNSLTLIDCARKLRDHCNITTCEECAFDANDEIRPCRIMGMPDDWDI